MNSVVLTQAHTHAGQAFKAGEALDVDGSTADWLIANGIARRERQPLALPSPQGEGGPSEPKSSLRKESKS